MKPSKPRILSPLVWGLIKSIEQHPEQWEYHHATWTDADVEEDRWRHQASGWVKITHRSSDRKVLVPYIDDGRPKLTKLERIALDETIETHLEKPRKRAMRLKAKWLALLKRTIKPTGHAYFEALGRAR